jgi:glycosyltransferase involved in cell wall biosynthesis
MRIGIQAESLKGGKGASHAGIGRYSEMILHHLFQIGSEHEFVVFVPSDFEPTSRLEGFQNARFVRFGHRYRIWRIFKRTPLCLKHRIEVFFNLSGPMFNVPLFPQACTIHDLFPFDYPEMFPDEAIKGMQALLAQQCRKADRLFAVSENTKQRIIERFGRRDDDIIVTPNGPGNVSTPSTYESVSAERLQALGIPFQRYFFTLGTVEPRKNLIVAVQALAELRRQAEFANVGLVVGGAKGWKDSQLAAEVERLGLKDAVIFLGFVETEDLPDLFARAEAFICPSLDEGFGIPVLEAMMYGAPVVTSHAGALPEVGGDSVLYFDPRNASEAAAQMGRILSDPELQADLRHKGLERSKLFSWERTASLTLQGLLDLKRR